MGSKPLSRRDLLTWWRNRPTEPVPPAQPALNPEMVPAPVSYTAAPATPRVAGGAEESRLIRPPGALPEAEFLATCQRCGNCVSVCPVRAIQPIMEDSSTGTPRVDTRSTPCELCEGLKCTQVCPSGALTPLSDPRSVRMGVAVIDAGQCLAYRGAPCKVCVNVCPVPGVLEWRAGTRTYVPVPGAESCVGCGLCHRFCPVPTAIRIVRVTDAPTNPVRIEMPAESKDASAVGPEDT